jgi:hypothetical protein
MAQNSKDDTMTRLLCATFFCGLLGCEDSPRPPPSEVVSVVAEQLTDREPEPAASPACAPGSAADCEEVQLQLEAARRALARNQADRAQRPGDVNLLIRFVVEGRPLQLEQPYALAAGEVRVRAIRYWLSQLSLIADNGRSADVADSYYLMEARGQQALRGGTQAPITLPAKQRELIVLPRVATNAYSKIAFNVGVDAPHNDDLSLAAGELTVLQNMASMQWNWFTSYIFTQFQAGIADETGIVEEERTSNRWRSRRSHTRTSWETRWS